MRELNHSLYDGAVTGILASHSGSNELKTQALSLRILIISWCPSTTKKNYGIILQYKTWTKTSLFTIHLSKL
jgi:hypothetical protein